MSDDVSSGQADPLPKNTMKPQTFSAPRATPKKQTPSIANIFKKERTVDKTGEKDIARKEKQAVTAEQVREKIAQYLKINHVSGVLKNTLLNPIDLKGNAITLTLVNAVEKPLIQKTETSLLIFLRKELQSDSLYFEYRSIEHKEESKPDTNAEIFHTMTNKNPALLKLKDAFGLDPAD